MRPSHLKTLRTALFLLFVLALVCLPFVIFGESFVLPILEAREHQTTWLVGLAIILLASDSVAPVPATLVIIFLAAKAGTLAGIIGGTLGMSAGVLTAGWIGREAVGRLAPRFFPEDELIRLRNALQRQLVLTLACWRSVPVLAETSVIVAAATGVPVARIFWVTVLPNFIISTIYSVAAEDSLATAAVTFFAIIAVSFALWWLLRRRLPTA